jgi:type IV secretory pathway VirB10-like protein
MDFLMTSGLRLGPDFSLPRIKNNYKGDAITPRILFPPTPPAAVAVAAVETSEGLKADPDQENSHPVRAAPQATAPLPPPPVAPAEVLPVLPVERRGWLKKEARKGFLRNWKSRYFVLDQGLLTYYENSATQPPYGQSERGKTLLVGAKVEQKGATNLLIRFENKEDRDLQVQAADAKDCTEWLQALQSHIRFVNSS